MSEDLCDVGVVGLGVMGANLARNFASRGHRVAGYARHRETTEALAAAHPEAGLRLSNDLPDFVASIRRPRRILLMVPAGAAVDAVIGDLAPLLEPDDIVIDGGNSHYPDTDRRAEAARSTPWHFFGAGVSGGEEGALRGPSIMPGGDREAWNSLRSLLESIAATSDTGPCVTYCGRGSAGHFVKMVHNGIEYGDMQLIAEAAMLLRRGLGLSVDEIADIFDSWNAGELESFLIEISAQIFRTRDPERPGEPLLDAVLDKAGQKGTGRWTVQAALDLGVAVPTLSAAVDARIASSDVAGRERAAQRFRERAGRPIEGLSADQVRAALFAAKIASYTQGFELLQRASGAFGYGTELPEVARIWKAGCIIRARFLDEVSTAFREDSARPLILAPAFSARVTERLSDWRSVVRAATGAGLPAPGLSASLAWFDTLTTARGSADLIQAQRDSFGSHTYERRDHPGKAVHSDWSGEP